MNPTIARAPADLPTSLSPPKTALVTGAGRRIGAHIARRLHAEGFDVAVHFNRSGIEAQALCDGLNQTRADSAIALQADLRSKQGCDNLLLAYRHWRPALALLVNNASVFERTPFGDVTEQAWQAQLDGNLKPAFFVSQAALPALHLSLGGSIINICDARWDKPLPGFSAYASAKAAIVALTRGLSVELAPQIRVNAIGPGSLDWPEGGTFTPEQIIALQAAIPLRRIGSGDDIADAVLYLAAASSYVTGQIINVDGGISAVSV